MPNGGFLRTLACRYEPGDRVELQLERIWQLTGLRRHADALDELSALSVLQPEARDVLYLQALNLRLSNRVADALAVLETLQRRHPRCSRLYQERGQCYVALHELAKAIDAFVEGVKLNPALPASWDMLERLFRMTGDVGAARTATLQREMLDKLPPEVVAATSLFSDGDLATAEHVIRSYLEKNPQNVGAMRMLARILLGSGSLQEAEPLLISILDLAPDFHAARLDYAMVLLRQQKYVASRQEAQKLLKHDPGNREYLKQYGAACIGLGDHEPVIGLYERLLTGMPQSGAEVSDLRLWRGNALKTTGRYQEAIADYRAAVAARTDSGVAWFSLANLKTYRFTGDEVARMCALESSPAASSLDRCYVCFALGKAFEDRGDFAASWRYYERGNSIKRAGSPYRPETSEYVARLHRQVCTTDFFAARAGWGAGDPAPVFIVGLPRSGSTLIEQILASHSAVEGTRELTEIDRYATELGSRGLDALTAADVRQLGERYIRETRVQRRLGRRFFIDKTPDNFRHIGLIKLMLPNAKIIDARREPMACCLGNLKQLFGMDRQEWSYSIDDVARYYRSYLELMRHWHSVLPGWILTVQHEDVVADLEGSVRRILEFCGLPFEPACVAFHDTLRSVHSASSEQVRRPIDHRSLSDWRHYEPWLEPLRTALGDSLQRYRTA